MLTVIIKRKNVSLFAAEGGGGRKGGGTFDIRGEGGRGTGSVVHNRESRDFRSPEVNISATFTPSRNYPVYTKKTVTSMLVNNRSRVDERSILRNGQVCTN